MLLTHYAWPMTCYDVPRQAAAICSKPTPQPLAGLEHARWQLSRMSWNPQRSRQPLVHRQSVRSSPLLQQRQSDAEAGDHDDRAEVDVRAILSDPGIEGDPLQFLKVTEAYWTVCLPPSPYLASSTATYRRATGHLPEGN